MTETINKLASKAFSGNIAPLAESEPAYVAPVSVLDGVDRPILGEFEVDLGLTDEYKEAIKAARRWAAMRQTVGKRNLSYVLTSKTTGSGKTHMIQAMRWVEVIWPEVSGSDPVPATPFYMAGDVIGKLMEGAKVEKLFPPVNEKNRFSGIKSVSVIAIDDIGTESQPQYQSAETWTNKRRVAYFNLTDHCKKNGIGIIATSNLSLYGVGANGEPDPKESEFAKWIGQRAFSRLLEMAPAGFMRELTQTPDYRLKKRKFETV